MLYLVSLYKSTNYHHNIIIAYEQSPTILCPGDELVITCATTTKGSVTWRLNGNNAQIVLLAGTESLPVTFGSFLLKVTHYNNVTLELVSTATNDSAPVSLNGTSIDCSEGLTGPFQRIFINYPGTS